MIRCVGTVVQVEGPAQILLWVWVLGQGIPDFSLAPVCGDCLSWDCLLRIPNIHISFIQQMPLSDNHEAGTGIGAEYFWEKKW